MLFMDALMNKLVGLMLCVMAGWMNPGWAAAGPSEGKPVMDLLLLRGNAEMNFGEQPPLDARYQQMLVERGFRVTEVSEREVLTQAYLDQFHLVVYLNPSPYKGGGYFDAADWRSGPHLLTVAQNVETLRNYVSAGGGLLIVPALEEMGVRTVESLNDLFAPYGLKTAAAMPRDPHRQWEAARVMERVPVRYGWTEALAKHPVTHDIRRIYYPSYCTRWDDNYTTIPLFPQDDAWIRLVDTHPGTKSFVRRGTLYDPDALEMALPGFDDPAIIVARPYGQGRIAVSGIGPFHLFYMTYEPIGRFFEANFVRIDGIAMEHGDGETPSDLHRLLDNLYRWLAESALSRGRAGSDPEHPIALDASPYAGLDNSFYLSNRWNDDDPLVTTPVHPKRILVGARSAISSGKGSPSDWAHAARAAGYDVICFTETLEDIDPDAWANYVAACEAASGTEVTLVPGLDAGTDLDNRFLLIGKRTFIRPHLLSEDGRILEWTGHMMLGMGDLQPVAARPQRMAELREQGALSPHLYSHLTSVAVATYDRAGVQVDDGLFAFKILAANGTHPFPVAVHEVTAPDDLRVAVQSGLQNYVNSDTPSNAAFFFRQSHARSGGNPDRAYVSSGPLVDFFMITNWQSDPWEIHLQARSKAPITRVHVQDQRGIYREFAPHTSEVDLRWFGDQGVQHWFVTTLEDAAGGRAILPVIRNLPRHHVIRCTDRQNFFAVGLPSMEITYTGRIRGATRGPLHAELPGVDLAATWCPTYRFPAFGHDFIIHENVYASTLIPGGRPPAADNAPIFNERPVPEYSFVRRFTSYMNRPRVLDGRLHEIRIHLHKPLTATGPVWPIIMRVPPGSPFHIPRPEGGYAEGTWPTTGYMDWPAGTVIGHTLLTVPLRITADGAIGFVADEGLTFPVGHEWHAAAFPDLPEPIDQSARALGFGGTAPFTLKMEKGRLKEHRLDLRFAAADGVVWGEVHAGEMPLLDRLPARVEGVNPRWPVGAWRPGEPVQAGLHFEGSAWLRLDVTRDGPFYLGHLLMADDPALMLAFASPWTQGAPVHIEVSNPTGKEFTATLRSPLEISDLWPIEVTTTIPAGGTRVLMVSQP